MKPFLSIILPFYNLESWMLERCLKSIYGQQAATTDFEIIIVDDGSKSFPFNVTEQYDDKENIHYIRQENQGPAIARNTGMAKAQGEYIYFVDPDDYLYPGTLGQCIAKLKEQPVDLITFGYKICRDKSLESIIQPPVIWSEKACSGAQYGTTHNIPACVWLYIFKKSICTDNNLAFPTDLFYTDDEEFTPKVYFFVRSMLISNLVMYAYYQREGSIVAPVNHTQAEKRIGDFRKVITHLLEFRDAQRSSAQPIQLEGLDRRIRFLSADYIIKVFRNHLSICKELEYLKSKGLYPLPRRKYSLKYRIFRILANRKAGLEIIRLLDKYVRL